jgi:hypothetical protein
MIMCVELEGGTDPVAVRSKGRSDILIAGSHLV